MSDEVSNRSRRSGADAERPSPGSSRASARDVPAPLIASDHQQRRRPRSCRRRRPRPARPGPSRGARSSFCIFIASTTRSAGPASTVVARRRPRRPTTRPGMIGTDLDRPAGGGRVGGPRSPARGASPGASSSTSTSNRQPSTTTSTTRPAVAERRAGVERRRAVAAVGAVDDDAAAAARLDDDRRPGRPGRRRSARPPGRRLAPVVRDPDASGHRGHRSTRPVAAGTRPGRSCPSPLRTAAVGVRGAVSVDRRRGRPRRRPSARPPRSTRRPRGAHSLGDPVGRELARAEARVRGDEAVERQRRLDAGDLGLVEGAREPARSPPSRSAVDDQQLGDQRVVVGRDPVARPRPPVSTRTPGPAGIAQRPIRPGAGAKSRAGSSAQMRTSIAWRSGRRGPLGGGEDVAPTAAGRRRSGAARGRCRGRSRARSRRARPGAGC